MASLIVKHRVSNFENWKKVFDKMGALRKQHNWISHTVLRDATDPNIVTVVNRVRSLADAEAYGSSDALHAAMRDAGICGSPEISFCEDADDLRY